MNTITLRSTNGEVLELEADAWDNFVELVAWSGHEPHLILTGIDGTTALEIAIALNSMRTETIQYANSTRIRAVGGTDTDDTLAYLARTAENSGDHSLADRIRNKLLQQIGSMDVRPTSVEKRAVLRQWAQFLRRSGGVHADIA